MSKIPADAFDYYFSLGSARSYQAVAAKCGVSKRSVTKLAVRERWQERVEKLEVEARARADQKAVESVEQMNTRHLKAAKVVQAKALETLRAVPLTSAMEAVRALDLGIRQERLARGEPSERAGNDVQMVIRYENDFWREDAQAVETEGSAPDQPSDPEPSGEDEGSVDEA